MTTISGSSAALPTGALSSGANRATPKQEDFLRLLTAQLSHQDPLSPSDPSAFVEQLATFSSLEQLGNIRGDLQGLALAQTGVVSASAVGFAGKTATVEGSAFELTPEKTTQDLGAYLSTGGALTARIKDSNGVVVRQIPLGKQDAGVVPFTWDGRNNAGEAAPSGHYTLEVVTSDGTEETKAVSLVRAPVEAVSFDKGYAELRILGRRYALGSILEIG